MRSASEEGGVEGGWNRVGGTDVARGGVGLGCGGHEEFGLCYWREGRGCWEGDDL